MSNQDIKNKINFLFDTLCSEHMPPNLIEVTEKELHNVINNYVKERLKPIKYLKILLMKLMITIIVLRNMISQNLLKQMRVLILNFLMKLVKYG